jgi:spore maturation protein CgeB
VSLSFVFLGLSITSSWGNGHATTYRALLRELARLGHGVTFLERDLPYYADNRDMARPPFGAIFTYDSLEELHERFGKLVREADVVVVGSYVPQGAAVGDWVLAQARGVRAFYDIDTPVTLAAVAKGACEYLVRRQIPAYELYLSFTGGPTLRVLEEDLHSPCARALHCSVDPELYYAEAAETRWDLAYLGTHSADRQPALERLLVEPARAWKSGRFIVAGAQYPSDLLWPGNVERVAHLSPSAHRAFYNAQRFALNVTRVDMVQAGWSPSVRLFEAAACGTPILTDAWAGLDAFFEPGREVAVVRSAADVLAWLRETPDEARVEMAAFARRRVLAEHTAAHRAEALCALARDLLASGRGARRKSSDGNLNLRGVS